MNVLVECHIDDNLQLINTLEGVQSLALGEPVARRQYYRSAWIEFDTAVNARKAMDRLSTQEVGLLMDTRLPDINPGSS